VSFRNGSGPEAAATVLEARKNVGIGNAAPSKPSPDNSQVIRVTLTGSDTCTAGGLTGRGHAPILMLCRLLLTAGIDPDESLEVYRDGAWALRLRVGHGAKLAVRDDRPGVLRFVAYRPGPDERRREGCGEAPPMRQNWPAAGRSS
jgi:hypothetical protein